MELIEFALTTIRPEMQNVIVFLAAPLLAIWAIDSIFR